MAALTQAQIITKLSESNDMSKAAAKAFIESISKLAYGEAKNGFTVPGLGKLVLMKRKARMGRNPATGAAIKIPAKTVVKFRVSKICKDAIIPPKNAPAKKPAAKKKVAKKK